MLYQEILSMIAEVAPNHALMVEKIRTKMNAGENVDTEIRTLAYHATSGFNDFTIQEIEDIRRSVAGPFIYP